MPNVVFVMTDDQGYGDLGCTGNPWILTPNIDRLYREAVRLTDYHVQPLCTPTRGAIMSGRRPVRNGAWATCWGRSILRRDETTMADVFRANGYRTGMFGKWHLGDNYPYRPSDRGFERAVAHKGGGVGQAPDFWGNNYFDDTYFHNGQARKHEGYCTDIWFEQAVRFIAEHQTDPFFVYLATNAPHGPYWVADRYERLYRDNPDIFSPAFYGMITNIDENVGKLDAFLRESGLADDTILIFTTDNGSSAGFRRDRRGFPEIGYNAGMRGGKGSFYDGGHRVPFFVRWGNGGVGGGRDIDEMCLDIDLLPTFIDICGMENTATKPFDGVSFAGPLNGSTDRMADRVHFLNNVQSTDPPGKERGCVMTRQWRLVHGSELYDIKADPGQRNNVAAEHPEVVAELAKALDAWWDEVSPGFDDFCCISLGNDAEEPTKLCAMDVMGDVVWNQGQIAAAKKSTGTWNVDVERPGRYRFSLRRWPEELPLPIDGMVSQECAIGLCHPHHSARIVMDPVKARLKLFDQEVSAEVEKGHEAVLFELDLERTGKTVLDAWFIHESGEEQGAYYVYVTRLADADAATA